MLLARKQASSKIYKKAGIFMIYNNVLEAVGHTPMIRLNRMTDENSAQVLVKFEGLNVGGSIKTRTALYIIVFFVFILLGAYWAS